MDIVNYMLRSSGAPKNLWGETLFSSCFILNSVLQKDSNITPYECWKGRTPNIQFFKVKGCFAKVSVTTRFPKYAGTETRRELTMHIRKKNTPHIRAKA